MRRITASIHRRRFLQAAASLAGAGAIASLPNMSFGQEKSLRILNGNLAWAKGLQGPVADAYLKQAGIKIVGDPEPYDAHYSKMLVEMSQGSSTYDLITSDCIWMTQAINNGWAASLDDLKAKNSSLPNVQYNNLSPNSLNMLAGATSTTVCP